MLQKIINIRIRILYFGNIYDMAMKIKFIIYASGNLNYGYCRLHFGYQIIIYTYITSMIETSSLSCEN